MKIFGKTWKEYILPIKYYLIGAVLVVISQYYAFIKLKNNPEVRREARWL